MAMDFETVKYLRLIFAVVFAFVGVAGGLKYFGPFGAVGGALAGYVVGWNTVDFFKGRAHK